MQNIDIIRQNPLKNLGYETDDIVPEKGFGAILARSGVGKTSFAVQIAVNSMLRDIKVLHISLEDPVKKINLWYKEVFSNLAAKHDIQDTSNIWETVIPNRLIMTLRVEGFSIPVLEERLTDLIEQNVFVPNMLIIDGIAFDEKAPALLQGLKNLAEKYTMRTWFTILTHRHEDPAPDGMPLQLSDVKDLFDAAVMLQPEGDKIHVRPLMGTAQEKAGASLLLDPSTMLITASTE